MYLPALYWTNCYEALRAEKQSVVVNLVSTQTLQTFFISFWKRPRRQLKLMSVCIGQIYIINTEALLWTCFSF